MMGFSEVFNATTVDNNGNVVTDLNKAFYNYYPMFIDKLTQNCREVTPIISNEIVEGYPDLIAYLKYENQLMWYFFLLSNFLDDPFTQINAGSLFYIYNDEVIDNINLNQVDNNEGTSRTGVVVELN